MAASVIKRYIDDVNDPIVHQLEALLGSFNHQLHLEEITSLKDTSITEYFTHTYKSMFYQIPRLYFWNLPDNAYSLKKSHTFL